MDPKIALDTLINLIMSDEFTLENMPRVMVKIDGMYNGRYRPETASLLALKFGRGSYDLCPAADKARYGAYWPRGYISVAYDIERVVCHHAAPYMPYTPENMLKLWHIVLGKIHDFVLFMQKHQNTYKDLFMQLLPQPIEEELLEYI